MKTISTRVFLAFSILLLSTSVQAQTGATLQVQPVLVDFGQVVEGGSARQNLTLTNLTNAPLEVTGFAQTGAASFSLDPIGGGSPCGSETPSLQAQEACTMEVFFKPDFPEEVSGTLTFTPNDDSSKAITVRLQGETPDSGGCSLGAAGAAPGALWVFWLSCGILLRRRLYG